PGVARALERALAKTPADRHPTAAAFAEALAPPTRETMSAPAGATARVPGLGRVLALYLGASGAVLALVFGAMLALGLPDWFFPGAVVLLLLGLPIMIATGLVQAGHAPARQLLAPVRHWLTWRRALVGGVLAFAGLGIAVTSYVLMRTLGIGPIGSLVAAGDIGTAGTSFVLSARLVSTETGDVLVAFRETAADSTLILRAIDRLSKRLRERIGESLKTIRANQPLDRVTTPSLAALKKYSQAI